MQINQNANNEMQWNQTKVRGNRGRFDYDERKQHDFVANVVRIIFRYSIYTCLIYTIINFNKNVVIILLNWVVLV